jgi:hypothetical protein
MTGNTPTRIYAKFKFEVLIIQNGSSARSVRTSANNVVHETSLSGRS